MKRILINATHNEEIRVALCKGNHLYDFDLENRTREQKKSNIYKGHVTRVEPSLEAVFVEYGSQRQGFLPIREIANEYLKGNARDENIRKLIKEGDELIVQVEKEERGNKGAALSTYVSLAGRYLVLMPNNPRGGGISRQISGKLRDDMKRMLGNLDLPKGMSVIIRTAGIGKTQDDLQHDLNHLLNIWQAIQEQNDKYPSPRLVHQEAGVVTRAVRDYLRDDITEIWIDNENAYIEAAGFIDAVMPKQADKLRKYTDYEPMFSRFGIEKQIETAYQREVRLPSGGSIVIDQTEALVSIDINSAKSTKGADVAETAYHTNLEAADEIARQLRLRDMGGLIVIDFIDMNDSKHQKEVEKRLVEATKYDRARVQFGEISRFGLMEMSRQRLRPSLEESTGYICPRCHGNGMIRDLRSLSLSIMRQIEQIALKERQGEVQAEVPTDIAAFLLNEKRDSLVYLEQDSGTRITILPHAHLESPNFKLHFNRDGFAPSSYERITDTQQQESNELGYDVDWQTADKERPEQQPTRQPRLASPNAVTALLKSRAETAIAAPRSVPTPAVSSAAQSAPSTAPVTPATAPHAVAWLANLFTPTPQAKPSDSISSQAAAEAIEAIVNTGAQSLGSLGQVNTAVLAKQSASDNRRPQEPTVATESKAALPQSESSSSTDQDDEDEQDRRRRKSRKTKPSKPRQRRDKRDETIDEASDASEDTSSQSDNNGRDDEAKPSRARRPANSRRDSRGEMPRGETLSPQSTSQSSAPEGHSRGESKSNSPASSRRADTDRRKSATNKVSDPNEVSLQVNEAPVQHKPKEVVHLSLDDSKSVRSAETNDVESPDDKAERRTSVSAPVKGDEADEKGPSANALSSNRGATSSSSARSDTAQAENILADRHQGYGSRQDGNQQDGTQREVTQKGDTQQDRTRSDKEPATQSAPALSSVAPDNTSTENATVSQPSSKQNDGNQVPVTAQASETVINETVTDTNETATEDKTALKSVTEDLSEQSGNKANLSSESSNTDDSVLSTGYDSTELFADRYVTAQKYGLASNDPRAVKAKREGAKEQEQSPVASSHSSKIRGTVGEFIHSVLPDAAMHLETKGVIASFIAAMASLASNQTAISNAAEDSATDAETAASTTDAHFDFSNYGYAPLDPTYLGRFNRMTQAVRQVTTNQGKTAVSPRPITRRASNDPRGQHPEFEESEAFKPAASPTHQLATVASALVSESSAAVVEQESAALLIEDKEVIEHLAVASAHLSDQSDESAEQTSAAEESASIISYADEDNATASALVDSETGQLETGESSDTAVDATMNEAPDATMLSSLKSSDGKTSNKEPVTPSKTTIASYKNMIENVAEQLLPQPTTLFNLTTPKVPKARSRKSKTEHKKPTQAEQSQSNANTNDKTAHDEPDDSIGNR
ncbi:MAG: Rne/Rng family ribonuclease [Psychrobacter sp.]|nr:Rne/Rng family ribonuclease [Psychrobacter sp.]